MSDTPFELTLQATSLAYAYAGKTAVTGLGFSLRRGEVLGLLGLNGAGKSTALQMLTGILPLQQGTVEVCGHDLVRDVLAAKQNLGYLPDTPPLYAELRVDDYLTFTARLRGIGNSAVAAAVQRAKERCGLTEVGRKLVGHLSKGYQQRVGIAQAIVHEPPVVILDEPTNALDPLQIREVRSLVRSLAERHSVLFSSHSLAEVEAVCDRVMIIHQGQMVADEPLATLQNNGGLESLFLQVTGEGRANP